MADGELTKQKIAKVFQEMAKTQSVDRISVREISERAEINRQTFYYHFRDRTALLLWIYEKEFLDPYLKTMNRENWKENMTAFLTKIEENSDFVTNSTTQAFRYILDKTIENLATLFLQLVANGDRDHRLTREQRASYARFISYGFFGTVGDWVRREDRERPEALVRRMCRFLGGKDGFSLGEFDNPVKRI